MNEFQTLSIPTRIDSAPYEAFKRQTHQGSLNQTRSRYIKVRSLLEFFIAFIGLIFSLPVFFIIVVLIKTTSRGPVFYAQERVGKDGRIFEIIKFRTMSVDAESLLGPVWAKKDDIRITNLGRILRRTHIDELPQLFNVIRGDMSIIGPRPERPFFVNKLKEEIPGYAGRLTTKPGITGLAQSYHRSDETIRDVQKKLRYDMLYIKRMCLALDIKIILQTLRVSISGGKWKKKNVNKS
jgi:lipopolysaccharide/colanic/teichoic acid biosynthesis glycosyltransferase